MNKELYKKSIDAVHKSTFKNICNKIYTEDDYAVTLFLPLVVYITVMGIAALPYGFELWGKCIVLAAMFFLLLKCSNELENISDLTVLPNSVIKHIQNVKIIIVILNALTLVVQVLLFEWTLDLHPAGPLGIVALSFLVAIGLTILFGVVKYRNGIFK